MVRRSAMSEDSQKLPDGLVNLNSLFWRRYVLDEAHEVLDSPAGASMQKYFNQ